MRLSQFVLVFLCLSGALFSACDDDGSNEGQPEGSDASNPDDGGPSPVLCGGGTTFVGGRCVPIAETACGPGTVWADGHCVPADPNGVPICGTGTRAENGQCVPTGEVTADACGRGTIFYKGQCVFDSSQQRICGLGTVEDRGKCVPAGGSIPDGGVCGTGTELREGVCVPNLDVCGAGTVDDDGVCILAPAACAAGTTYDVFEKTCVANDLVVCGNGTTLVDGVCMADGTGGATCGPGTSLVAGECVPDLDGCGPGTEREGDLCVAADTACGEGTTFDESTRRCLANGTVTCGAGTTFDPDTSSCLPDGSGGATCGSGTQLVSGVCLPDIDSCGAGTVEADGECVVSPTACGPGTSFDQGVDQCVANSGIVCGAGTVADGSECVVDPSACGAGTSYDAGSGTCIGTGGGSATCGTGTTFDPVTQTCLPGNILLGDCDGSPTPLVRVINAETTLAAGCYSAPAGLDLRAKVNVSPGVTVFMGDGKNLEIRADGQLNALCTEANPCSFVGQTDTPGSWIGIVSSSTIEANNALVWVTIANAGLNGASVDLAYASKFDRMSRVTIRDGFGYAIRGRIPRVLEHLTVRDHDAGSIQTRIDNLDRLATTLDLQPTPGLESYVEVTTFNMNGAPVVFRRLPVPYLWVSNGLVDNRAMIEIQPGVEIRFSEGSGWDFPYYSTNGLAIKGTVQEPVFLQGLESTRGYWRGITFNSSDTHNEFSSVVIRDAGFEPGSACLTVLDRASIAKFRDVTIRSCLNYGLDANTPMSAFGEFENVWLTENEAPLRTRWSGGFPTILNETTDLSLNDRDEVDAEGSCNLAFDCPVENYAATVVGVPINIIGDGDNRQTDVVVLGNRSSLPGGTYVFDDLTILRSLGANFTLGSATESLILEGRYPAAGTWNGLHIEEAAGFNNTIENVTVSDAGAWEITTAGYEGFYSVVFRDDVRIASIDGLTVTNGYGRAIYVGAGVVIDSCQNVDLSAFTPPLAFGPGAAAFNTACGL